MNITTELIIAMLCTQGKEVKRERKNNDGRRKERKVMAEEK